MADMFKYYGVNPPSYTGDPNDILGSALYNSGLLRNYGPVPRGGSIPGMGAMPTKNPNYPSPTFPPGPGPGPMPPSPQPIPPIGSGNDPNSPWRFPPGSMGSMPTWGFLPGMGIVPTPGVGQVPGLGTRMPTIMSPQEEFMIGLISQLVGPLRGETPPGIATDMMYRDFGNATEKAASMSPSPISSVSAGAGERKMSM